ncbi:MAG TPA: MIP/aquaporin family protein [Pseudolysinimonas sp.]
MTAREWRQIAAELLGSTLLAAVVLGSGISAQRLSPEDAGLRLFENAFATALGLTAVILMFAPISGASFNPAITLVEAALGHRPWIDAVRFIPSQLVGCIAGAILANLMFGEPPARWSTTDRGGWPQLLAEVIATTGLVMLVMVLARTGRSALTAPAVGVYIGAAYFFTSSSSFANPALTVGRMFSDSFAGISPASVGGFIGAQILGAALGWLLVRALVPHKPPAPTSSPHRPGSWVPDDSRASRGRP